VSKSAADLENDIKVLEDSVNYLNDADPCDAHNSGAYRRAIERVLTRLKEELRVRKEEQSAATTAAPV
jgi:hypothetical protein